MPYPRTHRVCEEAGGTKAVNLIRELRGAAVATPQVNNPTAPSASVETQVSSQKPRVKLAELTSAINLFKKVGERARTVVTIPYTCRAHTDMPFMPILQNDAATHNPKISCKLHFM